MNRYSHCLLVVTASSRYIHTVPQYNQDSDCKGGIKIVYRFDTGIHLKRRRLIHTVKAITPHRYRQMFPTCRDIGFHNITAKEYRVDRKLPKSFESRPTDLDATRKTCENIILSSIEKVVIQTRSFQAIHFLDVDTCMRILHTLPNPHNAASGSSTT